MGRARNILVILVLNIFLTLLVTVMMEYENLAERFSLLEDNVAIAVDMSIEASTASEELFSASYQEMMWSRGFTQEDTELNLGATVTLFDDRSGTWFQCGSYPLAMYYEENNRLPRSLSEYSQYCRQHSLDAHDGTGVIYAWLFGSVRANEKFGNYYKNIGSAIKSYGVMRHYTSADRSEFEILEKEYNTLDNMGLDFTRYNGAYGSTLTGSDSDYNTDNFTNWFHIGRSRNLDIGDYSIYFLTPYSLGVTYVPPEVMKPVFIANLDTLARLQKLSSGNLPAMDALTVKETLISASECLPTDVHTGFDYTNLTNQQHVNASNHRIVNDGSIEYDLDSVQVTVDYSLADFYSESYKNIASYVEGALSGYSSQDAALRAMASALKNSDTSKMASSHINYGQRIVAKVTVRMKVYVAYESSILQWLSYKDYLAHGASGDLHYGIKMLNPATGKVYRDGTDGTYYEYCTYISYTR